MPRRLRRAAAQCFEFWSREEKVNSPAAAPPVAAASDPPAVSVVTAVRNCATTIADTIRSVAEQDLKSVEHVVQDAASTDETIAVVNRFGGGVVRLESRPDSGIYDGFNNALARVRGKIVGFLNGDDTYESSSVLSAVATAFQDPEIGMVFGDVVYVKGDRPEKVVRYYSSASFHPRRLARGFIPAHPSLFVRRELFDVVGLYDAGYRIAGDFEWIARAFQRASPRYLYISRPFVRMRIGGASTSGLKATIRITREIHRACRKNGIATSYPRLLTRFPPKLLERFRVAD